MRLFVESAAANRLDCHFGSFAGGLAKSGSIFEIASDAKRRTVSFSSCNAFLKGPAASLACTPNFARPRAPWILTFGWASPRAATKSGTSFSSGPMLAIADNAKALNSQSLSRAICLSDASASFAGGPDRASTYQGPFLMGGLWCVLAWCGQRHQLANEPAWLPP